MDIVVAISKKSKTERITGQRADETLPILIKQVLAEEKSALLTSTRAIETMQTHSYNVHNTTQDKTHRHRRHRQATRRHRIS